MALPFTRGLWLKAFAVALAVLLRLVVAGDPIVERGLRVPLEFQNLPGSVEILGDPPQTVQVRVRGASGVLRRLEAGDVAAIIDLGSGRAGARLFDMTNGPIQVPLGVEVTQVIPSTLSLRLEVQGLPKLVPVVPVIEGEPAAGFIVGEVTANPAMVEVVGPLSRLEEVTHVITESLDVTGTAVPVSATVTVGVNDPRLRLAMPQATQVTVDIIREPVRRTLEDVPVRTRNVSDGLGAAVSPASVTVTVLGPPELMRDLDGEDVTAYVDLAGHGAGSYTLAVTTDPHRAFGALTVEPTTVQVTVQ
jgi:hypothetical protein